jgi:hypothetical protein
MSKLLPFRSKSLISTEIVKLDPDVIITTGFGISCVMLNGKIVYRDIDCKDDDYWKVSEVEDLASKHPNNIWEIKFFGPLSGQVFKRTLSGDWILTKLMEGFT